MYKLSSYFRTAMICLMLILTARVFAQTGTRALLALSRQAISSQAIPGFCLQVGNSHQVLFQRCFGRYRYDKGPYDTPNTLFDLASLTKVVATTTVVMKLYQQRRIDLNATVSAYCPGYPYRIRIRQLLDHSSGLPASMPSPYSWSHIKQVKPVQSPGTHYTYSDVNYLVLQHVLMCILHRPFSDIVDHWVLQPLALTHTSFNPALEAAPTSARSGVNDPMAYALSGVAGNAGLFATIGDVGRFARMLLNGGLIGRRQYLLPSTIHYFTKRDNAVANSTRALGFDTLYNPTDPDEPHQFSAGQFLDDNAYGHTGYTGTSIWISPRNELYVVLLSNSRLRGDKRVQQLQRYYRQQIANEAARLFGRHIHRNPTYTEKRHKIN